MRCQCLSVLPDGVNVQHLEQRKTFNSVFHSYCYYRVELKFNRARQSLLCVCVFPIGASKWEWAFSLSFSASGVFTFVRSLCSRDHLHFTRHFLQLDSLNGNGNIERKGGAGGWAKRTVFIRFALSCWSWRGTSTKIVCENWSKHGQKGKVSSIMQ